MEEKKENNRPIFALRLAAAFSWWVLGFSITYHHLLLLLREYLNSAFARPIFMYKHTLVWCTYTLFSVDNPQFASNYTHKL